MKNFKRYLAIIFAAVVLFAVVISTGVFSKSDYATLTLAGDGCEPIVLLNNEVEYAFMEYYNCTYVSDLKIRNGKSLIGSLFKEDFNAYSSDMEKNYIFCKESIMLFRTYGLYVKKDEIEKLFKPTSRNISEITISSSDKKNDIVRFDSTNKKRFEYFMKKYYDDLVDYTFPTNADDEDIFNEDYRIDVYYQDGAVSRFFRCITEAEYEKFLNM